jgi:hypothetical protein
MNARVVAVLLGCIPPSEEPDVPKQRPYQEPEERSNGRPRGLGGDPDVLEDAEPEAVVA